MVDHPEVRTVLLGLGSTDHADSVLEREVLGCCAQLGASVQRTKEVEDIPVLLPGHSLAKLATDYLPYLLGVLAQELVSDDDLGTNFTGLHRDRAHADLFLIDQVLAFYQAPYGHLSHLRDYESVRALLESEFFDQLHAGCVMFFRIPSRRDHLAAGIFQ